MTEDDTRLMTPEEFWISLHKPDSPVPGYFVKLDDGRVAFRKEVGSNGFGLWDEHGKTIRQLADFIWGGKVVQAWAVAQAENELRRTKFFDDATEDQKLSDLVPHNTRTLTPHEKKHLMWMIKLCEAVRRAEPMMDVRFCGFE